MKTNWYWAMVLLAVVLATVVGALSLDRAVTRNGWKLHLDGWSLLFILSVLVALWVIAALVENKRNTPQNDDAPGWILAIISAAAAIGLWEFGKRVTWEHTSTTVLFFGICCVIAAIIVFCARQVSEPIVPVPATSVQVIQTTTVIPTP